MKVRTALRDVEVITPRSFDEILANEAMSKGQFKKAEALWDAVIAKDGSRAFAAVDSAAAAKCDTDATLKYIAVSGAYCCDKLRNLSTPTPANFEPWPSPQKPECATGSRLRFRKLNGYSPLEGV